MAAPPPKTPIDEAELKNVSDNLQLPEGDPKRNSVGAFLLQVHINAFTNNTFKYGREKAAATLWANAKEQSETDKLLITLQTLGKQMGMPEYVAQEKDILEDYNNFPKTAALHIINRYIAKKLSVNKAQKDLLSVIENAGEDGLKRIYIREKAFALKKEQLRLDREADYLLGNIGLKTKSDYFALSQAKTAHTLPPEDQQSPISATLQKLTEKAISRYKDQIQKAAEVGDYRNTLSLTNHLMNLQQKLIQSKITFEAEVSIQRASTLQGLNAPQSLIDMNTIISDRIAKSKEIKINRKKAEITTNRTIANTIGNAEQEYSKAMATTANSNEEIQKLGAQLKTMFPEAGDATLPKTPASLINELAQNIIPPEPKPESEKLKE